MGWKRIGNHSYLYRSIRVAGRVRSEYLGRGELAELAGKRLELAHERRAILQAERDAERIRREADRQQERELDGLVSEAGALAREALQAAGFHSHRGQWRKRRGQ